MKRSLGCLGSDTTARNPSVGIVMPGGVTLIQVFGGHVALAMHGSTGGAPPLPPPDPALLVLDSALLVTVVVLPPLALLVELPPPISPLPLELALPAVAELAPVPL